MTEPIYVGDLIALARRRRGLSQRRLAQLLGVHQPNVSRWESGVNSPSVYYVVRLAQVLRCSTDDLLVRAEEEGT